MKFIIGPFWLVRAFCLATLLFVAVPALAADDTMSQATPSVQINGLHYLVAGQPDAAILLPPPPLMDSAEQAADMQEVKTVYHAAGSNDIAAAYSERKFSVFNFTEAVGDYFNAANLPKTALFFEKVQFDAATATVISARITLSARAPSSPTPASSMASWKNHSVIPAVIPPNPWCSPSSLRILFPTSTMPSSPMRV